MSAEEIFKVEARNKENLYDIHFYLEGNFWRAYEWSAYLSRNFPSNLSEDERLRGVKKLPKGYEDGYVLVGLRLTSFDKYFPNITNNEEVFEMLDKHIIIHSKQFFKDEDFTNNEEILKEWKDSISASPKEKKNSKTIEVPKETTIDDDSILREIVSYPIESKNLIECLQFLSYIKDKTNKLMKTKKVNS